MACHNFGYMLHETRSRSIVKAISYRFVGSFATAAIVLMFTGKIEIAATVGVLEALAKIVLFFIHERFWARIGFGKVNIRPIVIWILGPDQDRVESLSKALLAKFQKIGLRSDHIGDTHFSSIEQMALLISYLERNGTSVVCTLSQSQDSARKALGSVLTNLLELNEADLPRDRELAVEKIYKEVLERVAWTT